MLSLTPKFDLRRTIAIPENKAEIKRRKIWNFWVNLNIAKQAKVWDNERKIDVLSKLKYSTSIFEKRSVQQSHCCKYANKRFHASCWSYPLIKNWINRNRSSKNIDQQRSLGEVELNTLYDTQYAKTKFNFVPHSCFNMTFDKTTLIKKRPDINKMPQVL